MASAPPRISGLTDWRPLARGGFATVWQARQESLDRLVAVKIDQRTLDAATERRRFLRESGAAGRMSGHPGIVTVHDAGILTDDRPYLVMELCPGGSLTRWLKPEARPTQRRVRDVGVRIADALAAAHSRGVLHRDVKPANILIDAYDHPGLADFGLAALPEPGEDIAETLEAVTPAYAPPEVFRQQPPSEFGDVYSLAATLYALLKGLPPRSDGGGTPSVQDALARQSQPIERIPGVDPGLMDTLLSALAAEPADRPTAAHFRDQLSGLEVPDVQPGAELPRPVGTDEDQDREADLARPPVRGRRRSVAVLAVVSSLLVLLFGAVALVSREASVSGAAPVLTPPPATTAVPSPAGSATPVSTSTPVATSAPVPAGYRDCSADLGGQTYCATSDECWGGSFTAFDQPALGSRQDCDESHVYQTFAAGRLPYTVRRQSQLDEDPQVTDVCRTQLVNEMLPVADRTDDWEVLVLPPQTQDDESDDLYRCIFGRGERTGPLSLTAPG